MVKEGYIGPTQAKRAFAEQISLQPRQQGIIAAPHFLFWLTSQLPQDRPSQIRTTIDRSLQQFVEAQVKDIVRNLTPKNASQAAALVIDNHSGEVLAYVGSVDYFAEAQLGRNDGVQALRQPGSTLKPFLYQLALEQKIIRPNTVLADVPTYYPIPGARLYSPSDYSETFAGPVRIRIALANSLNVPAVRVLEKVGVDNFLERLHQLGFKHLNQSPEYYGLGLSLGSGEVNLWELARAYHIASLSSKITNHPLKVTITPSSHTSHTPHTPQTPSPTWALITDMLSDRHARARAFGVDSVLNLPFPAAVKTGTSSNFRDTWTVGYTTDYTVATWVGNFDGEPMQQVSGVMGAAPLWHRIMLRLHERQKPDSFPPPAHMVKRPICAISGLKPTPACPSIVREYFYPEDLQEYQHQLDNFYQMVTAKEDHSSQYRVNLPAEYDEWLATQSRSTLVPSTLKILSPRQGDSFLIDETGLAHKDSSSVRRLEFKITGKSHQTIEWWLNGKKLATNSSDSFFWQLHPGEWTLEVRNGQRSDRVSFQVQLAPQRLTRWGFSLADR
ncbi:MAG: penicillin-binding transpeptidase domain-containing protein [Prochloraceae cyanobacterium]